jgi:hypothetical protein
MNKIWFFLLLALSYWLFLISTIGCGSSPSSGSGGNVEQNLPPLSYDVRVTLEALFNEYGTSVPKTAIINALNAIAPSGVGPSQNHIEYISSTNALTLEGSSASILNYASVPDAILDQNNKVRLYFVDGHSPRKFASQIETQLSDSVTKADLYSLYEDYYLRTNMSLGCAIADTEDGTSFTYDGNFRVVSFPDEFTAVDPSIVKEGSNYKLYFFMVNSAEVPEGGDVPEAEHHMLGVATSNDGSCFTYVGTAYAESISNTLADPEIFCFDGTYRAFFMANYGIRMVESGDGGLTFSPPETTILDGYDITNIRFASEKVNDYYRIYFGDSSNNLTSAYSNNGSTWIFDDYNPRDTNGQLIGGRGAMPAVKLNDDTWKFYHH